MQDTNADEVMMVLGCILILSYNKLPALHIHRSNKKSMGNLAIREAVSKYRFQTLNGVSKTYYVEEVLSFLKRTMCHKV